MRLQIMYTLCVIGAIFPYPSASQAVPTPVYDNGATVPDAITGDNFVSGGGWFVSPGADGHVNDFMRERPLSTSDFGSFGGQWVHPGKYYSYLDIVSAQWGYDDKYLYFAQTLYGNWSQGSASSDRDYGEFGSGTLYNIILGLGEGYDANGSILLRASGDTKEIWTGPTGTFVSKGTQGWLDKDDSVGGAGVTVTKEDGDTVGNGYEYQPVLTDGYLVDDDYCLFARITGATLDDDSRPVVEIALDYLAWNSASIRHGLPTLNPDDISLVVFEVAPANGNCTTSAI